MLNALAISAVAFGGAALVAPAAPPVIETAVAVRGAVEATSAAAGAASSVAEPVAYAQERGVDPEDPRFGEAIGRGITRMTGAIGRAVRGAEASTWSIGREAWSEGEAVELCAVAAQDQASRNARIVSVGVVDQVDRVTDGWNVGGTVLAREDFRDRQPAEWAFSCRIERGQVAGVDFGDRFARR